MTPNNPIQEPYRAPEQFAKVNKSNLGAAMQFAKVTFDAPERLLSLQLAGARDATSEGANSTNRRFFPGTVRVHLLTNLAGISSTRALPMRTTAPNR